jgi:hypothetical protein
VAIESLIEVRMVGLLAQLQALNRKTSVALTLSLNASSGPAINADYTTLV